VYKVVTPDECIALADQVGDLGSITLHPLLAGMPPELGWESLELFESEVLPRGWTRVQPARRFVWPFSGAALTVRDLSGRHWRTI
jgi:hypothetical protein